MKEFSRIRCVFVESAFRKMSIKLFKPHVYHSNSHTKCICVVYTCIHRILTNRVNDKSKKSHYIAETRDQGHDVDKLCTGFKDNDNMVLNIKHRISILT